MFNILLVSHGNYSKELLRTAQLIMGEIKNAHSIGFELGENVDDLAEQVAQYIRDNKENEKVLVLTDMRSGSPYNVTVQAMCEYDIRHLSGINLPVFLEIVSNRDYMTLEEAIQAAMEVAPQTILDINCLLEEMD